MEYKFTVHGKVPSKSNSYKIITIAGHSSLAKTPAVKKFESDFYIQCPCRGAKIKGYFSIEIDVYHENMRPDIDNGSKVLLDCLQACKVIENDRYCVDLHMRKLVDKTDPRIEITLKTVDL